jgi:hypothetical protein
MKSLTISPLPVIHVSKSLVCGDDAGNVWVLSNDLFQLVLGNRATFEAGVDNPFAKHRSFTCFCLFPQQEPIASFARRRIILTESPRASD